MNEEDAVALLLESAAQEATIGTKKIATEIVKVRQLSLQTHSILIVIFP
jgi:hypothetical protein